MGTVYGKGVREIFSAGNFQGRGIIHGKNFRGEYALGGTVFENARGTFRGYFCHTFTEESYFFTGMSKKVIQNGCPNPHLRTRI